MDKLHEIEKEFREAGSELVITGLERHQPLSAHPTAARQAGRRAVAGRRPAPAGHERMLATSDDTRHAPPAPDVDARAPPDRGGLRAGCPASGR